MAGRITLDIVRGVNWWHTQITRYTEDGSGPAQVHDLITRISDDGSDNQHAVLSEILDNISSQEWALFTKGIK